MGPLYRLDLVAAAQWARRWLYVLRSFRRRRAGRAVDRHCRRRLRHFLRLRPQTLHRIFEQRNTLKQSADTRMQLGVLRQRQIACVQHIPQHESERHGDNETYPSTETDQGTNDDADPDWHSRRASDCLIHNCSRPLRGLPSAASDRAIAASNQQKSIVANGATPGTATRYREQPPSVGDAQPLVHADG